MKYHIYISTLTCLFLLANSTAKSQGTNQSGQFWNEFAFTKTFNERAVAELDLGQTWTGSPSNKGILSYYSQFYVRGWFHYTASPKWRLSIFYAWYYNKYVPEIDQREYPEGRLALQSIYFIKRTRYILSTRFRMEDRHISNKEGAFEGVYRFRDQIKLIYPFNNRTIVKGTVYGLGSEEVFFKTPSDIAGDQFFDRNRFTIGAGYSFTDDIQIELTYANEYLPRPSTNELYNAVQLNFSINNLFPDLKKKLSKWFKI